MALIDRLKSQAAQVAQKAQGVAEAGQAKIDQVQTKRQLDSLYRDLGAAVYAERTGQSADAGDVDRLVGSITAHLAEHGDSDGSDTKAEEA